jgi:diacylglycerol kinase family enzyme
MTPAPVEIDYQGTRPVLAMNSPSSTPDRLRRCSAVVALLLSLAFGGFTIANVVRQPLSGVLVIVLIAIVPIVLWYSISRGGAKGRFAAVVAVLAFASAGIVMAASLSHLLVHVSLLVMAWLLARFALGKDTRTLKSLDKAGLAVGPAKRAALIVNPHSGGAKAERFHLEQECLHRGIEPIALRPGDDIREVAERAIEAGADAIGVAGGDGSLAAVASVAAAHDVPFVVVPAGTFNHFALDLGLDRDDVVGSLDAFGEAVERRVDVGEVNGRPFVNNVSLGLYASIVRLPEYRSAKIDTTLKELPRLIGPGSQAFDLRFEGPDGKRHEAAHVLQVSNGPYGKHLLGVDTRPRLDTGELGITSLLMPDKSSEGHLLNALASGRPESYEGFSAWSAPSFEVTSDSSIAAGIDGEACDLESPLRFVSRPQMLRVRLSRSAIGYSPAARTDRVARAIPDLWRVATGRAILPSG